MRDEVSHDESTIEEAAGELVEKTMEERAKEVGRDGAYLEVDAKDLISAYRNGTLSKAKIVVVKAARIELSVDGDIRDLVDVVGGVCSILDGKKSPAQSFPIGRNVVGMSDQQAGAYIVSHSFLNGVTSEVE
jgi:hypothetical protein